MIKIFSQRLLFLLLQEMGCILVKPEWVDSNPLGTFECHSCTYKATSEDFLREHCSTYHNTTSTYVLYLGCTKSISGRSAIEACISEEFKYVDCTGGQMACYDGDLQRFGDLVVEAARNNDIGIYYIYRMYDPGLGLDFPAWWVQGGIDAGTFQEYQVPADVLAGADNILVTDAVSVS